MQQGRAGGLLLGVMCRAETPEVKLFVEQLLPEEYATIWESKTTGIPEDCRLVVTMCGRRETPLHALIQVIRQQWVSATRRRL